MGMGVKKAWSWVKKRLRKSPQSHFIRDYERLIRQKLKEHPNDRPLALAQSVGSPTMESFHDWGQRHVAVLRHHGLADGMSIYDLGCGCGRTAQELHRSGWQGHYMGADIIPELVDEIKRTCPGYNAVVHRQLSIVAPDDSLDILFHWSVFTHLYPEESFLYMEDIFRCLKPGGKLVFSFLEMGSQPSESIFYANVEQFRRGRQLTHLDQFLHRDWICHFAAKIGFTEPQFTDGNDGSNHPEFGQSLSAMTKPLR